MKLFFLGLLVAAADHFLQCTIMPHRHLIWPEQHYSCPHPRIVFWKVGTQNWFIVGAQGKIKKCWNRIVWYLQVHNVIRRMFILRQVICDNQFKIILVYQWSINKYTFDIARFFNAVISGIGAAWSFHVCEISYGFHFSFGNSNNVRKTLDVRFSQ